MKAKFQALVARNAQRLAAVGASAVGLVGTAHAELPTGVTTAITTGGTDGGTLMGALAAAGAALYIVWKILKKAGIML